MNKEKEKKTVQRGERIMIVESFKGGNKKERKKDCSKGIREEQKKERLFKGKKEEQKKERWG